MPMHKWYASEPSKLACSAAKVLAGLTTPDCPSPTTGDVYAMLSKHGEYSSDWRAPPPESRHERPIKKKKKKKLPDRKKLPDGKKLANSLQKIAKKLKSITSPRRDDLDDEMSTEELIKLVNEIKFHNYGNGPPQEGQLKITSRIPVSPMQTCSTGLKVPGKRQAYENPWSTLRIKYSGLPPKAPASKVSGSSLSLNNSIISESWERFMNQRSSNGSTTSLSSNVSTNSARWGSSTSLASSEISAASTNSKSSISCMRFGELLESLEFYRDSSGLFARRGDDESGEWVKLSPENEQLMDRLEFFQDAYGLFAKWVEMTSPESWFRLTMHFPNRR